MFLGDPQFPKLAMVQAATSNALHHVFQVVFKKYSRLELTRATDRPIAVAGVERRLADEMGSSVTFGVFTSFEYLHRSLLWRRAGDVLHWIEKNTPRVPTWSWMSFIGPIDYVEITSTEMEWNRDICLSTTEEPAELMAPITTFAAKMLRNPSLLILDYRLTADVENLKCVVIGKELSLSPSPGNQDDEVCYVLVVSPVQTCGTCIQYERLGVATLHKTHLALEHGTERARII